MPNQEVPNQSIITLRVTAAIIGLIGALMAWQGAQLTLLGGTPYYLCAGLLMVVSAVQLWRARASGFVAYGAALLLTLAWAVYEAGNAFWLVGSRIWLIGLISLWLCSPVIRRQLWGDTAPQLALRTLQVCAFASATVLLAMTADLVTNDSVEIADKTYGPKQNEADWTAYGGNKAGTRYAPHDQINAENVSALTPAWEVDTGRVGRFSGTPIQIEDGLYLCTAQNVMIALDPDTGAERWRFDPKNETSPYFQLGNCRGVTYYHIPERTKGEVCAERIYTATTDARMIAVDLATGQPCEEFGDSGEISLLTGMGEVKRHDYFVSSPPTVASGALVVGGWVADNRETEEPSGVVRGYDPRTGELLWAWDIGRQGRTVLPPEGEVYTRGTPNVWSLTSADDELGLVYVPTGNATPDYFGGHRTEAMDKFSSSIVAIDAKTGLTRWHFQTTHHDIWDYDVPSQPTLVDITLNGEQRKAVIVATKRGELFVLDRATGEVLTEVTEKPVPQTDLPGERTSATQPFSTGMPSFAHPHIGEHDLFGLTPFDQMSCRKTFLGLRWEGTMTPPSVQGTILYPGPPGGMNWGSVAVDERRQLLVVNSMHLPFIVHMIPREEDLLKSREGFNNGYGIGGPQLGTPFAASVDIFASPIMLPCLRPPYGEIAVVDLTTQQIVWRRGMGPLGLGLPYSAGSIVTAGGLIFISGIMDGQVRAIDLLSGDVLWQDALGGLSGATPMSYVSPKTGRQYLIATVPGEDLLENPVTHGQFGVESELKPTTSRVIAYALPKATDG